MRCWCWRFELEEEVEEGSLGSSLGEVRRVKGVSGGGWKGEAVRWGV